jgi:hypothetical protein
VINLFIIFNTKPQKKRIIKMTTNRAAKSGFAAEAQRKVSLKLYQPGPGGKDIFFDK